jgi:hypothetical protein
VSRLAVLVAIVALAAGCGGSHSKPEHATLTALRFHPRAIDFVFDSAPTDVKVRYSPLQSIGECGSGIPVRPQGTAVLVVDFRPARTSSVPKRIVMPSGPYLELDKVCDFEADVGWAIGMAGKRPWNVSHHGSTVTITFA